VAETGLFFASEHDLFWKWNPNLSLSFFTRPSVLGFKCETLISQETSTCKLIPFLFACACIVTIHGRV
jgi:hypothetical protein